MNQPLPSKSCNLSQVHVAIELRHSLSLVVAVHLLKQASDSSSLKYSGHNVLDRLHAACSVCTRHNKLPAGTPDDVLTVFLGESGQDPLDAAGQKLLATDKASLPCRYHELKARLFHPLDRALKRFHVLDLSIDLRDSSFQRFDAIY